MKKTNCGNKWPRCSSCWSLKSQFPFVKLHLYLSESWRGRNGLSLKVLHWGICHVKTKSIYNNPCLSVCCQSHLILVCLSVTLCLRSFHISKQSPVYVTFFTTPLFMSRFFTNPLFMSCFLLIPCLCHVY